MIPKLKELMIRAERWPESAQEELLQVGMEIESTHRRDYVATDKELQALDEADNGDAASQEEVEAVLASFGRR